jgi:nucleotide-binding universal stress UspA family protein
MADLERWSSDGEEDCRLAAIRLDGVPAETSVVFGDRAGEIGVEAECFDADLVVMPPRRRGPAARMTELARRLFAGQPASELAVPRVWALRPEPMG